MSAHAELTSSVVPTVALDPFLEERGIATVSLVKLEIETGEPAAIRGMPRTLERDTPPIFCEVLSDAVGAELKAMLAPLDYRFYHLTGNGPVERSELDGHPEWLNYLFAVTPLERLRHLEGSGAGA